jgi:PAS domain S-box-containing protein
VLQLGLEYQRDIGDIETQLEQIQNSYSGSLASSLWSTSQKDLELQLGGILRLPDLVYVEVVNEQGKLVASAGGRGGGRHISRKFSLYFMHREHQMTIGEVSLEASTAGVYQRLREKIMVILVTQTIKTFLVSFFILFLFQMLVGRHLKRIATYSDQVIVEQDTRGLYLERQHPDHSDELDQVVTALNGMHRRVQDAYVRLQESEFRWKFALEGAGDGVWDWDMRNNAVLVSPRWREMLGYTEAGPVFSSLAEVEHLMHEQDLMAARNEMREYLRGNRTSYAVECRMHCQDGSWRWMMARGMVVERDSSSRAVRMLGTQTDISERKEAEQRVRELLAETEAARAALSTANEDMEEQVRQRTAQLQAANRELEAFSYSVSHDLRSPLRGIDGWSLALQEDYGPQLDQVGNDYLERVRKETQRMGQLIDDMLQFSRYSRSDMAVRQVDLSALADGVAMRIRERFPDRRFDFRIAPELEAQGDLRLLEVVLTNLLENAAKFTGQSKVALIEFGARSGCENEDGCVYYVRDNGAGFDMNYAQKLFGVFQRMHKSSEFPGTGIGLATVQRIIQRHGGRIWAEAKLGEGACFYFVLNRADAAVEQS